MQKYNEIISFCKLFDKFVDLYHINKSSKAFLPTYEQRILDKNMRNAYAALTRLETVTVCKCDEHGEIENAVSIFCDCNEFRLVVPENIDYDGLRMFIDTFKGMKMFKSGEMYCLVNRNAVMRKIIEKYPAYYFGIEDRFVVIYKIS